MFYEPTLLCKGGRFYLIWMAANKMHNSLSHRQISSFDVAANCDQVMKYVVSFSPDVKSRFSLSLSSKLLHGIIIIYHQQATALFKEVITMMKTTPKTCFMPSDDSESFIVPVVPKRRVVRKKKEVHSDDTDLDLFTKLASMIEEQQRHEEPVIAPIESITMLELDENVLLQREQQPEIFPKEGDLGRIDDLQSFEEELAKRDGDQRIPELEIPLEPLPEIPIPVVPEMPIPEVAAVPEEQLTQAEYQPQRKQARAVPNITDVMPTRKRQKPNVLIKINTRTKVAIDKAKDKEKDFFVDPVVTELSKNIIQHLLAEFVRESSDLSEIIKEPEPIPVPEQEAIPRAEQEQMPRAEQELIPHPEQVEFVVEGEVPVPPRDLDNASQSILKSHSVLSVMRTPNITEISAAGVSGIQPWEMESYERRPVSEEMPSIVRRGPLVTSTPQKPEEERAFERIFKAHLGLRRYNEDITGYLNILRRIDALLVDHRHWTIDQVSDQPITRKTIAYTFGKLLVLHAAEYVVLIPEENSLELKHLTFGEKYKEIQPLL